MGEHLRAAMWNRASFPELLSPSEAAKLCHISEKRIMELAMCGFAPCAIIDDMKYLFFKKDVVEWAKDNLLKIQEGEKITVTVKAVESISADRLSLPESLYPLADRLKEAEALKSGPCIYFLISQKEVVYVGQSINLMNRIGQHIGEKAFDRVVYLHLPEESLLDVETALIRYLKPKLNKAQNNFEIEPYHKLQLNLIGMVEGEKNGSGSKTT